MLAKCAYSIDPIPTAVDVAEMVESALESALESDDDVDVELLGELGIGDESPRRVTKAHARGKRPSAEPTRSVVRTGHRVRGVPQWQSAEVGAVSDDAVLADAPEGTIDVASGMRDATPTSRFRSRWLVAALALAALGGTAIAFNAVRDSSSANGNRRPEASEKTSVPTKELEVYLDASASAPATVDAADKLLQITVTTEPAGARVSIGGEDRGGGDSECTGCVTVDGIVGGVTAMPPWQLDFIALRAGTGPINISFGGVAGTSDHTSEGDDYEMQAHRLCEGSSDCATDPLSEGEDAGDYTPPSNAGCSIVGGSGSNQLVLLLLGALLWRRRRR